MASSLHQSINPMLMTKRKMADLEGFLDVVMGERENGFKLHKIRFVSLTRILLLLVLKPGDDDALSNML